MRKRKPLPKQTQFALFPDQMKPKPGEFSRKLWLEGLVSKTARRKRPKKNAPLTINVLAEVSKAYEVLFKADGINVEGFLEILRKAPELDPGQIAKNRAIVSPEGKTAREMQQIRKAIAAIAYFVKRNRKREELAKAHAPDRAEYAGKSQAQKHLKSIAGKRGK